MRVISRNSAGVKLFDVADDEHVVSAARIEESEGDAEADVRTLDDVPVTAPVDDGDTGEDLAAGPENGE